MELTAEGRPARNFQNGTFLRGHIPHNKGKKWAEWMDMRKAKKILRIGMKNLKGRSDIGGWDKKPVVAITLDGRWFYFESAANAERITGLIRRNITRCCQGKCKHCGKFQWFYFNDDKWLKLINNE
jgi:hypothetical protein